MRVDIPGLFEDAEPYEQAPQQLLRAPSKARLLSIAKTHFTEACLAQIGHVLPWVPCLFGAGIAVYFSLKQEPSLLVTACIAVFASAILALATRLRADIAPFLALSAAAFIGFSWCALRAHWVAAPVLAWHYNGPVEGRIVAIDRSASGALRATLDHVILGKSADPPPARIRVSLFELPDTPLFPGQRIALKASLSPPSGPAEPGGYDFQRHAWFEQLGALGYSRKPPEIISAPKGQILARIRLHLSQVLWEKIPGEAGAVAAAITTGDRAEISNETTQNLRRANLSHLLAISGLHMGLMTGVVFTSLRVLWSLFGVWSARFDGKKIAAAGAILSGCVYLVLSGSAVATERAFIMALVFFGAIFLDRRALTLRGVALAALGVLILRPEALIGPGFQMSFAATTALVLIFGRLGSWGGRNPVVGLVLSSLVAGAATAPFAAAHFNILTSYGLIANFFSVPVMGAVVMPSFVAAVLLAPIGLADWPLWVAEQGLKWILWVAEHIAQWPKAVHFVASPAPGALSILVAGALWLGLWQGRARWIGLFPIVAAVIFWNWQARPHVLVAQTGGLVGVMTETGRSLSKTRGDGFSAKIWLENDGDPVSQDDAAARADWNHDRYTARMHVNGYEILTARGRKTTDSIEGCGGADIFITNQRDRSERSCLHFDRGYFERNGSIAIDLSSRTPNITTAKEVSGARLWSRPELRYRLFQQRQRFKLWAGIYQ